jgi:hypothetical protein
MAKIRRAQQEFLRHFIGQDFKNATEAYRKAYPNASYDTARVEAAKCLAKPNVQALLSSTLADILSREKIPLEKRLFDYWMRRAFYDLTEIIDLNGTLKLTEEELREKGLQACIDSVNKKTDANGNVTVTYKFADKDAAAEHLQQYIQMIKRQPEEITIRGSFPVIKTTGKDGIDDGYSVEQGDSRGQDNGALESPAEAGEGAFQPGL